MTSPAKGKKLAFVLAVVAAILCAVAFTISYLDGEFDWVPLVMGVVMVSLAVSSWRGFRSRG